MWCFMSKEFNVELVWLQSGLLPIDMAPQTEYKRLGLSNEAHVGLKTGLLLMVYKEVQLVYGTTSKCSFDL